MKFERLFVLGAGTMGNGIAQVGLQAGMRVTVCDSFPAQLEKAKEYFEKALSRLVTKGRMTEEERRTVSAGWKSLQICRRRPRPMW